MSKKTEQELNQLRKNFFELVQRQNVLIRAVDLRARIDEILLILQDMKQRNTDVISAEELRNRLTQYRNLQNLQEGQNNA